ncbi:MAG: transporter substrate-binding domain-containing protein [Anaerovibrio sp.]|uniref:transporter substrate-binding domain-containing diguanylate cyclase n=1 Tax=Anaerovibrio sp. TaxID=1872532 RepID=UPI0025FD2C36|nr:GGDEF domain-containing protein [Anaerovibrio sp.]MCR5175514.1 transporter substrate-binding domain-containing protein [Anaerovibrio sp.]
MPNTATEQYRNVSAAGETTNPAKIVRVGYLDSPHFMQGMSDDAKKYGMAYDYLQKVSYYTNWDYIYVYGNWEVLLDKLYKGEIDIMAGVSKTPEREEKILFPNYAMGTENYYIYTYANNPLATKGLSVIPGKTVSVNKNTVMLDILEQWNEAGNHQIKIVSYSGNEDRYKDFNAHHTDATVDTDNAVPPGGNIIPITKIGQSEYYVAVNMARPDLVDDLNMALTKINATNPGFIGELVNAYFSDLAVIACLSDDEMEWLTDHPVITVGYVDDYLPLSDKDENGEVSGILKDILKEMASKLNIQEKVKFSYVAYPDYDSMIRAVKEGSIDMAFPVDNDVAQAEKDDLFLSSEVICMPMYLIYSGEFSELKLHRMASKQGNSISDLYIRNYLPNTEVFYYDDIDDMLDAIKNNEVDGCVMNQFRKDGYLNHVDYRDLHAAVLKEYSSRSFAVKRGNSELLSILNRGITSLPSDFSLTSTYPYTGKIASPTVKDFIMEHLYSFMLIAGTITVVLSVLVVYIFLIHRNRRRMQYIARHDSLTGLLNRHSFNEFVDTHGKKHPKNNIIIVAMDLNGLKTVNDTLGHDAGDELIIGAAKCMQQVLSPFGQVYRTGGDEFMAIIEASPEKLSDIILELNDAIEAWHGVRVKTMSISIGTSYNDDAAKMTLNELIILADQQMYKDKANYYKRMGIDRRRH